MTSFSYMFDRALLVGLVVGLMQVPTAAFSQVAGHAGTAAAATKPDSRMACPPDATVNAAVELVRDAYEAAYDEVKDTQEPAPLIRQLSDLANQTTDPAKKYALLVEAEAIATQYENYTTALELLAKRAEQFQLDGLKLKGQLLKRLAGPKIAADLVLLDEASDTAEQAMQAERFDVAFEAAALAVSVAKAIDREQKAEARKRGHPTVKTAKDDAGPTQIGLGLIKKAASLQARVTASQKLFTDYSEAVAKLKVQPDDAAANSAVAKYLCFVRGDWQTGLPVLAKSDLGSLKQTAAREIALMLAGKPDPKQLFELAGAWWSASESKGLSDDQESAIKDHAAGFYAEVVENLSDVLEKQLAKSRLRGLDPRAPIAGSRLTIFDFSLPNQLEKFTAGGSMKETSKGLEFLGQGPTWIDSRQRFSGPLEATFVASTFPDKNLDCYVGIFSSQPGDSFVRSGIHLHWGCFSNTRTILYVGGRAREIRHRPIEAGRDYTITLRVDKDRQLTVLIDENVIDQELLSSDLKLEGSVRCGGGIGHVIYRSATVVAGQPAASIITGTRVGNAQEQGIYLSDLREINPVVGLGEFGKNGQTGCWGWNIIVNNEYSPHGISTHCKEGGEAGVSYDVPAGVRKLTGKAALIDKSSPAVSPVSFKIVGDGNKVLWKSPRAITHSNEAMPFEVEVAGLKTIRLIATCAGSQHNAAAVWCEPRFITAGSVGMASTAGSRAQPDPGRLTNFRDSIGKTIAFSVTGALNGGFVWGNNPYTADSQLARAAVHAGVLKPGESGIVNVTILPGQPSYEGTASNGVTTGRWGSYNLSYRIEIGRRRAE